MSEIKSVENRLIRIYFNRGRSHFLSGKEPHIAGQLFQELRIAYYDGYYQAKYGDKWGV